MQVLGIIEFFGSLTDKGRKTNMKNYTAPELEVISADAAGVLQISTGDVDVNVGEDFF